MHIVDKITRIILFVMGALVFYKGILTVIGVLVKAKVYPPAKKLHDFGVVIAARNEKKVIAQLIESIKQQNYGKEIKIFVVADNCSDNTAQVARDAGAIVYERFNADEISKGYALRFLFEHIEKDYGILNLDGYFVFDADNLLNPDFVNNMNNAFDTGLDVVRSYMCTKNFDTNFITAAYGIHFLRHSMIRHRPRSFLGTGTQFNGTGFLVRSDILKDGWQYVTLTEDAEFTMRVTALGKKVGYCENAVVYDEQPYNFKVVCRQRIRWAKGRLLNYFRHGNKLVKSFFKRKTLREKFTCYDLYFTFFPSNLFSLIISLIYPVISIAVSLITKNFVFRPLIENLLMLFLTNYLSSLLSGILTVVRERKSIHCSTPKLIYFVVLWPWFDLFELPILVFSLFVKVKWKPIKHDDTRNIDDILEKQKSLKQKKTLAASEKNQEL